MHILITRSGPGVLESRACHSCLPPSLYSHPDCHSTYVLYLQAELPSDLAEAATNTVFSLDLAHTAFSTFDTSACHKATLCIYSHMACRCRCLCLQELSLLPSDLAEAATNTAYSLHQAHAGAGATDVINVSH